MSWVGWGPSSFPNKTTPPNPFSVFSSDNPSGEAAACLLVAVGGVEIPPHGNLRENPDTQTKMVCKTCKTQAWGVVDGVKAAFLGPAKARQGK